MIDHQTLSKKDEELTALFRAKHGLRGKSLKAQLSRAGRLVPKHVHRDGAVLAEAQTRAAHPKLAATVDASRIDTAFASIKSHLKKVDPKDRRKGKVLGWLGYTVFNMIVLVTVLIVVLNWRGFIG